jgi:hypothetical protein
MLADGRAIPLSFDGVAHERAHLVGASGSSEAPRTEADFEPSRLAMTSNSRGLAAVPSKFSLVNHQSEEISEQCRNLAIWSDIPERAQAIRL